MSTPGATLGPCSPWIDGQAVNAVCSVDPGSIGPATFDVVAYEASAALYEISGRRFPGTCLRTVRPCGESGCWGPGGHAVYASTWGWSDYYSNWRFDSGAFTCGCAPLSTVKLAGYPVQEIIEVTIDGALVDPATYRLDDRRNLIRLHDPGPPARPRAWPSCQNLALDDNQPGTFSVTYKWGESVPQLGKDAAAALACQLFASIDGGECKLPPGTTKVVRENVSIDLSLLGNWFTKDGTTGIPALDLFLRAYWAKGRRRPAVWSPDVQQFAPKVGY